MNTPLFAPLLKLKKNIRLVFILSLLAWLPEANSQPNAFISRGRLNEAADIKVYYDYLDEDNRLTGGVTTITIPPFDYLTIQQTMTASSVTTLINNGPSSNRIDLVFLGDGYTTSDLESYANHTANVLTTFLNEPPLDDYASFFNVHRVDVVSNESGVDEPDYGIYRDTALDMTYNCSDIARLLCIDVGKASAAAALAPDTDQILALANSTRYGGAGYPALSTLAGNNSSAVNIALHEFGHSFANLADEYHYSDGATYPGSEPIQPNISIYTATEQLTLQTKWFRWLDQPQVDAFEGAFYHQYGIYRPTNYSKMRSLSYPFEVVNTEQLILNFYQIVSPITGSSV